ncbi:MAG: hypothetical protein ACK41C_00045 [Phenylobacterium sp.]|uniref:hypothetical protein n=1 Tax=Phenylobacterium sp. TaxID=1871053 RepID=UPI00391A7237
MKTRPSLLGLLLGFGLLILAGAAPEPAAAQCCAPPPPPPCCQPPTPPCCQPPPPPPPPSPPCCEAPRPPSVNVHVSNVSIAVANARAGSGAGAGASAVFYGGGGGGGGYVPPMATGVVQLNVEGPKRMKRVAYQATRTRTKRIVIQAVCIDARQVPHPASQISPDRDIAEGFEGELYRCMSGTWLQATLAEYDGKIEFSGGKTLACRKGDALYRGRDGQVSCRPATPQRNCFERSLLRRFGAGVKILTIVETETYTAYREEEERSESTVVTSMSLDGGVGGTVY